MKKTPRIVLIIIALLLILFYVKGCIASKNEPEAPIAWRNVQTEELEQIQSDFAQDMPGTIYFPAKIPDAYSLQQSEIRVNADNSTETIEHYFQNTYLENPKKRIDAENIQSESLWFVQSNDADYIQKYITLENEQSYEEGTYIFQSGELENTLFWKQGTWMFLLRGKLEQQDMETMASSLEVLDFTQAS